MTNETRAASPADSRDVPRDASRPASPASTAPVWVVDDDRAIRWVLSRALERAGHAARTFENGSAVLDALEAVKRGEAEEPAVILSDIRMPGISGVELVERLNTALPQVPVLIMTAFSDLESAVSAYRSGAFEYLTKPFDIEKVLELVARAATEYARRKRALEPESAAESALAAGKGASASSNGLSGLSGSGGSNASARTGSSPSADARRTAGTTGAVGGDGAAGSALADDGLIGRAPAMQEVFRAIGRLSQSSVTVLLTGESGAGKEVVARALWQHSPRSRAPYVALNMAAIPRELLESELFGHEKGAFTGASASRAGRFGEAAGGTLFLDEIGDMPMELQTRLLRVLSSGTYYRVGGREPLKADVRVIAATNRDLEAAVREGTFREDLYHRLNVIRLRLPPLRDRREDVKPLAEHFLTAGAVELGLEPKRLTPEALAALERFPFPGNVRQLENICRWLLVMAPSQEIRFEDLPYEVQRPEGRTAGEAGSVASSASSGLSGRGAPDAHRSESDWVDWAAALEADVVARLERNEPGLWGHVTDRVETVLVRAALAATKGRRMEAAERLGVGRNTLTRKIRALGLED